MVRKPRLYWSLCSLLYICMSQKSVFCSRLLIVLLLCSYSCHAQQRRGNSPQWIGHGSSTTVQTLPNSTNQGNSNLLKDALRVAKILGDVAQQSGTTTGIRNHLPNHLKVECLESVLRYIAYVEEASHRPRLFSGTTTSRILDDEFVMSPLNYAKSMVMLARDMDAQPWGAFAFHAPSLYLPFLQQLATDLMD